MRLPTRGRRADQAFDPSVPDMLTTRFTYLAAALTFALVPAGLDVSGGNLSTVHTVTLAGSLALMLLFARRWPRSVLLLTLASVFAFRSGDLINGAGIWPATAAFVAVALSGRMRTAIGIGGFALLYWANWNATVASYSADQVFTHLAAETLILVAALAGVSAYRSSLNLRAESARRIAQAEQQQEIDARRRRAEERVEIARDLHDVVSHTLAVVGVHLNVALDAFDTEPEEARASLKLAQDVRNRAMADLKALVGVLREGSVPALESLSGLVEQVRTAGLEVSLNEFGDPLEVPAPVATAVLRVVQESLTNTVRHASGATRAIVTLRYSPSRVVVDVRDDGTAAPATVVDGHGIAGMRERVAALGGALTAGPDKSGFVVRASIPVGG
jgi:signal transduction histidine kinase